MALGQNIAGTFILPQDQQGNMGTASPSMGAPAPDPMLTQPSGLQYVEGRTQNVYDKFYKVKQFAKDLWNNHRIDVTNPDFANPYAVKANHLYQKAIADLNFEIEDLKQGQKMYSSILQQGGNMYAGFDPTQQSFTQLQSSPLVRQALSPGVQNFLKTYMKGFSSEEQVAEANTQLEQLAGDAQQRAEYAQSVGDQAAAEEAQNDLNAIGKAMYDRTDANRLENATQRQGMIDQTRKQVEAMKLASKTKGFKDTQKRSSKAFAQDWGSFRNGDSSFIEGMVNKDGNRLFVPGTGRYSIAEGKYYADQVVNSKGESQTVEIDLNNPSGGFAQFAQKFGGYESLNRDALSGISAKGKPTYSTGINVELEPTDQFNSMIEHTSIALTSPEGYEDKTSPKENVAAVSALEQKVQSDGLIIPKGIKVKDGKPTSQGELIHNMEYNARDNMFTFEISREDDDGDEIIKEIEIDANSLAGKKVIQDIVKMNDIMMYPIAPSMTYKTKSFDLTPEILDQIPEEVKNSKDFTLSGGFKNGTYYVIVNPKDGSPSTAVYEIDPKTEQLLK